MVLEVKLNLVWNLPCMQIFVIWAEASWQMTVRIKLIGTLAKTGDQTGLIIIYIEVLYEYCAICKRN